MANRQLQKIQNKTNSKNRHLVFSTFVKKKNKKNRESVLFRLDNVFGTKTKYHRLRCFLVFFLNIKSTRCIFSKFVSFCIRMNVLKPFLNVLSGQDVFTKRPFSKGEFLLEYKGELISKKGVKRENTYSADVGRYLFFFQHGNKSLWHVTQS